jgi:hypothetical protein
MPIDPSIIGNVMAPQAPQLPDVNAMLETQTRGAENIFKIETARQQEAKLAQQEAAQAQEAATLKALLPAYTYGIQTGDIAGALDLVPPEMQESLRPYVDALAGKSPQEVQAALIGSLSSSPMGQEALGAIQRAQTAQIQLGQLDVSRGRLAFDTEQAGKPPAMTPYQEAQITLDREKFAAEQAEKEAKARGEIGPTEAQKGEVWNPEKQRYDVVPGTKLYRESAAKHTEDYKAKTAVQDRVAESLAKIDYVLADENKDGFEYNFGGYYAAYAGQYMPVEQAQDVKNTIESLKADITQAGLELMRSGGSIGAITEREWPLLEKQIAAVTPYVGEKRARELLQNVAQRLRNIQARATQAYDQQWGDTQFYEPSEALPVETGDSEEELPEGTTSSNW